MHRAIVFAVVGLSIGSLELPAADDAHGDPLPKGAVARIGTVRLRHGDTVASVGYSADGRRITSTDGKSVAVWDARTGKELVYRFLPAQPGCWPVVSPDGSVIACRLADGNLGVLDTETGKERCRFPPHQERVLNLAFSNDNRRLVGNNDQGQVLLWDATTGKLTQQWKVPHKPEPLDCRQTFTPDGKTVVHGIKSGLLFVWDAQTGKELRQIQPRKNKEGRFNSVAVSPDGELVATLNEWWRLELWQLKTGRFVREIEALKSWIGPTFTPDGKQLVFGTREGEIRFWDVASGKLVRQLPHDRRAFAESLTFSPDGKTLVVGGNDHVVHVWDVAGEKERFPSGTLRGTVVASILADGKTIVSHCHYWSDIFSGSINPQIRFWDLQGRSIREINFDPKEAHAFAVAPDGKSVMLANGFPFARYRQVLRNSELRSSLRLCEIPSGREIQQWMHMPCEVNDLRFSPDGQYCLSSVNYAGSNRMDYHRIPYLQIRQRTGAKWEQLRDIACTNSDFVCSPDSQWVAVMVEGGWDVHRLATGKLHRRYRGQPDTIRTASPSGRVIVCSSEKELVVKLAELATGKFICQLDCKPGYLSRPELTISPDGRIVAGALHSAELILWDAFTGKQLAKLEGHRGNISSVSFAADGRHLVTSSADPTILIWDLDSVLPRRPKPMRQDAERLEKLWADLQDENPAVAYRAIAGLSQSPEHTIALIRKNIAAPTEREDRDIQNWITELSNNRFAVRSRAETELRRFNELAEAALRRELSPRLSLESRRRIEAILDRLPTVSEGRWLTTLRAFETLELIGTPEARQLLEALSKGPTESPHTLEAKRSLQRISRGK